MTIHEELKLSYAEYVNYLLDKYGSAQYDFFRNESMKSKNPKVTRTKEGLFCHHIDEDKAIMLSNMEYAREQPFAYQKKERLVYANYFEHLLLHIKIAEEAEDKQLGIGGVDMIVRQLNDVYLSKTLAEGWRGDVAKVIINRFDDYILILQYLKNLILETDEYKGIYPLRNLAKGWDGTVNKKVHKKLKLDSYKEEVVDDDDIESLIDFVCRIFK